MEIDTSFNETLLDLQSDGPTPIVIDTISGEAVTLPAGVILTTADFSRSGR